MENSAFINQFLYEFDVKQLATINNAIDHLNDESLNTIGKIFNIQQRNLNSLKNYFKNIVFPKLYAHDNQIEDDFLDFIDNLDIIKEQIIPKQMINLTYLDSHFCYIQTKNDEQKNISIPLLPKNKNKVTFLQIIPDGLLYCSDFSVKQNHKQLENIQFRSYLKLQNKGENIKLIFENCPQKLFFIQILFYKKLTKQDIAEIFRKKFLIPNEVTNFKAQICHGNHVFKLTQLIESIQKKNSITCPICNQNDPFLYFNGESNDKALDFILNDDEMSFNDFIRSFSNIHIYFGKYKMPSILSDCPSFIALCSFFGSIKCFNSLLYYYEKTENLMQINQKDHFHRSPIHFACFGGNFSIIKNLLKYNENFDCVDKDGLKPIHYAAIGGKIDVIKYFFTNKFDVFSCNNKNYYSPLHIACKYGYLDIVEYYVEFIIPKSEVNDYNNFLSLFCPNKITPLHIACKWNNDSIIDYFIKKNLLFVQMNYNSNASPLQFACQYGSLYFLKQMTNSKYEIANNKVKIENLFKKAILGGHLDIISFLIKNFTINTSSVIIILDSIASGNFEIANFLIQNIVFKKSSKDIIERLIKIIHSNNSLLITGDEISRVKFSIINKPKEKLETDSSEDEKSDAETFIKSNENSSDNELYESDYSSDEAFLVKSSNNITIKGEPLEDESENESIDSNNQFHPLPMPIISIKSCQNIDQNQFIPQSFRPCPFLQNQVSQINFKYKPNQMQIMTNLDPSSIDYVKNHSANGPLTFVDLSKLNFKTKEQVKIAVSNISIIEHKSVHIIKSEPRRIVYKCVKECSFSMTWKEMDGMWLIKENGFNDHTCTFEMVKQPKFHSTIIDCAINSFKLSSTNIKASITILDHLLDHKVPKKTLKRRLQTSHAIQFSNDQLWQIIPGYLHNNILNGGLSDMIITENNEVYSFAMVPQYAKLLLKSNAILPVIIIDGTFQSSIYRGSLVIVMIVSSNRTNIPIGWSWGPSENEETIRIVLNLIKDINENIETIISDEGTALKAVINDVFPNAIHKFCAWHISKNISNHEIRTIFWQLLRSDHPLIFQCLMCKLYQIGGDIPKLLDNGRIGMFSRYFEGVKENELITSSPCESINAEISKMKTDSPIKIFHYLERIGYNRCIDLLSISSTMTPYYTKRKKHVEIKAQRMQIIEEESYQTSRTIIDPQYPFPEIRWEVNTRDYRCPCGKYQDRGFPCAHMIKAFQDLNQSFDHCVHECYFTATIKKALKDIHSPVSLDILEKDENLHSLPAHVRACKTKRYLFSFEKTQNKK